MEMVLLLDIVRARREESTENSPSPLNERDRKAADEWIREHLPDPDGYSLEDSEEAGSTESYFFLRYRDSATVVHKVAVKDGKVSSVVNRFPDNAIRRPFPLRAPASALIRRSLSCRSPRRSACCSGLSANEGNCGPSSSFDRA